ncbi:MAG: hypothetical protein ACLSAO_03970 [Anaerovoracaceae bacterium]
MRDYKLKSSGLPPHIYTQVTAIVRGYEDMKAEYENILYKGTVSLDGMPKSKNKIDITSREAVRRADISKKIEAVEESILSIPEEYRQGVWDNAVYGTPYPIYADRTTYWRYKARFFRLIAKHMYWI